MKSTENDREKGIVVFGTGDFSDIVSFILEKKQNRTIAAYTVDAKYKTQDQYNVYRYIGPASYTLHQLYRLQLFDFAFSPK